MQNLRDSNGKAMRSALALGAGVLAVVAAAWALWVDRASPDVVFVLPEHFSGVFVLVQDRVKGVVAEGPEVIYPVPMSGVLKVRSLEPVQDWHRCMWKTSDDEAVPCGADNAHPDNRSVFRLPESSTLGQVPHACYIVGSWTSVKPLFDQGEEAKREKCASKLSIAVSGPEG